MNNLTTNTAKKTKKLKDETSNDESNHFFLMDDIKSENVIGLLDNINQYTYRNPKKDIHLHISSDGGHVNTGLLIYNFLKQLKNKVITYGSGHVYSAAFLVLLAGDERVIPEFSMYLTHGVVDSMIGGIEEGEVYIINLKKTMETMIKLTMSETGFDRKKVTTMHKGEHQYTSYELLDLGFPLKSPLSKTKGKK